MDRAKLLGLSTAVLFAAGPALAQTTAPSAPPATTAPPAATTREAPAGAATTGAASAFARMKASDLIGKAVYDTSGDRVGEIDDVVINKQNKATAAVLGVGGFLGIGEKKVAVPMNQLAMQGDRIVASGLTKDSLERMAKYEEREGDEWDRYDRERPLGEVR